MRFTDGAAAAAKSLHSCQTLCDPIDCSPAGSTIPGIIQARTLEWVAISFSNAWKWKVKVKSLCRVRLLATPWTAAHQAPPSRGFSGKSTGVGCHCLLQCMKVKSESEVAQSCPTLSDPMDCSPPGSSVHGIFQARGLEWVAMYRWRAWGINWLWSRSLIQGTLTSETKCLNTSLLLYNLNKLHLPHFCYWWYVYSISLAFQLVLVVKNCLPMQET